MKTVRVDIREGYDIFIAAGLLEKTGEIVRGLSLRPQKIAVITDENVRALYLQAVVESLEQAGFSVLSHTIPAGEASKSAEKYLEILHILAENQYTRTDMLLALGGGVVGDLTGFVAATYLRGVPYVQVPTTLLAMVDSSVGGKTAIDLPAGKNLVGAFYQPVCVLIDPDVLRTLSAEIFADGCAEVIKYGMIMDAGLLETLEQSDISTDIIEKCVVHKRTVVLEDEFDTGVRQLLNFGHTLGHAIEKLSAYSISHGQAVAMGMYLSTRAAVEKNHCPQECLTILEKLLKKFNLPMHTDFLPHELYNASLSDKKRAGGTITEVVPVAVGTCELKKISINELKNWIETGTEK
jgi:3-dehydroquinate synthase